MLFSLKKSWLLFVCLFCANQIIGASQQPKRDTPAQIEEAGRQQVYKKAGETFGKYFVEVNGFLVTQRRASGINMAGDSMNDLLYCKDITGFDKYESVKRAQKSDVEEVATFKIKAGRVFVFAVEGGIKLLGQDTDALIMTITLHKYKRTGWETAGTTFEFANVSTPHMKRQPGPKDVTITRPVYNRPANADNPISPGFALLSTNASEAKKIMSAPPPPPPPPVIVTPDSTAESFTGQFLTDNFIQCPENTGNWYSIVDSTALLEIESVGYEISSVKLSNVSDPSEAGKYRVAFITGTRYRNHSLNKDFVISRSPILWILVQISAKAVTIDSVGWHNPKSDISDLKRPSSCEQVQRLKRP